jgi:hypothetical protein
MLINRSLLASTLGVCGAAAAIALGLAPVAQAKTAVCKKSLGIEATNLKHVSSSAACKVVLKLWHYEQKQSNAPIYKCGGAPSYKPKLLEHSFDGWRIALTPYFRMSKGRASFDVTGTDFPIACD